MNNFKVCDYMRDDIKIAGLAIFRGFAVSCKKHGDSYNFELNNYNIWRIRNAWQTARIVDGVFVGHKSFEKLDIALQYVYDRVKM